MRKGNVLHRGPLYRGPHFFNKKKKSKNQPQEIAPHVNRGAKLSKKKLIKKAGRVAAARDIYHYRLVNLLS